MSGFWLIELSPQEFHHRILFAGIILPFASCFFIQTHEILCLIRRQIIQIGLEKESFIIVEKTI